MADAAQAADADLIMSLLDARKGEIFWALYTQSAAAAGGPGHAPADALADLAVAHGGSVVAVGEVTARLPLLGMRIFRSAESDLPHARHVLRCALARYTRGDLDDVHALEPLYVRPPDITLPAAP
jgi:tRNA A37 threonylcarbamoyladenosine modification protein TsaB